MKTGQKQKVFKLDYSQPFNKIEYECEDCGKVWNTSEYLQEFSHNYQEYSTYVRADWNKIFRTVLENLFKPQDVLNTTACPWCCIENEPEIGSIEASYHGQKTDEDLMRRLAHKDKHHLEYALKRLYTFGKRINSDGEVVDRYD